jgi:hypothetical protein
VSAQIGGTETAFIYARTDNSGTIAVDSGTLAIGVGNTDNGGVDTGSYTIASEATLDFAGGTRTLGTGSSITGTGTLKISSGVLDISRSAGTVGNLKVLGTLRVTLEGTQLSGGNGYLRVTNQADIASGTVQVTSVPGFCGQLFDSAVLLTYGSSNGHFRQERFDAGGQAMSIIYTAGSVSLRIDSDNCDVTPPTMEWARLDTFNKPSDLLLQRDMTYSATDEGRGVRQIEYGWTQGEASAGPTTPVQISSASYAGAARVDYSATRPRGHYQLTVRARDWADNTSPWVAAKGANASSDIVAPPEPIFVALGDSITAGHHKDTAASETNCYDKDYGLIGDLGG